MWCASYHQPSATSLVVLNRQAKQNGRLRSKNEVFFLLSSTSSSLRKHQWQICNNPKTEFRLISRASALPPSESGDITTFLLVSLGMISMYLLSNFLVPSLLFKSLEVDEDEDEDEDSD